MFKKIGVDSIITSDCKEIMDAKKYLLPGVGSFDYGITNLKKSAFFEVLETEILVNKKLVLGICLGMQLLTKSSEEGTLKGLGWIDAHTKKLELNNNLAVPHMGWNQVRQTKNHALWRDIPDDSRFYFVHSYYFECVNSEDVAMHIHLDKPYCAAVRSKNIWGAQFHPEKSHKYGLQFLKLWLESS